MAEQADRLSIILRRTYDAPPELLVLESTAAGPDGERLLEARISVTFTERPGGTEVTVRADATGQLPGAIPMLGGMRAGWNQSLQCLEDLLSGSIDRQILVSRLLPAPPERVFRLWTSPDHLAGWWGPDGFSISVEEMEVRPGGTWRFTMHGPDGVDYANTIVYDEVSPPDRLVYTHLAPRFRTTVTFDEMMGMTALSMRLVFATAEELHRTAESFHAREGAEQTMDRLLQLVAQGAGAV